MARINIWLKTKAATLQTTQDLIVELEQALRETFSAEAFNVVSKMTSSNLP